MAGSNIVWVAAIDFGTTFSGYAFAAITESKEKVEIRLNKNWGDQLGFDSFKTPTSVLLDKKGCFQEFGYKAESRYCSGKKEDFKLYRHFKMLLHNTEKLKLNQTIPAVDGTEAKTIDIVAHAFRFLKKHLYDFLKEKTRRKPNDREVLWVVTVPAIWNDEAKLFMRKAAMKASLIDEEDSERLHLALEPEVASLSCRNSYSSGKTATFPAGTKYLVVDCGGGTVDITVHEMLDNEKVKEIHRASGGALGGTRVDNNFIALLEETFGKRFLELYQKQYSSEYLSLLTNFERSKKEFDGSNDISLQLPYYICDLFRKTFNGKDIFEHLKEHGIECNDAFMSLCKDTAVTLFKDVVGSIVEHVDKIISHSDCRGVKYVMLVGGFSESSVLQKAVKKKFKEKAIKVLIPNNPQLAVLNGAILFGLNPSVIHSRIARYSYGFETCPMFDESLHEESRKVETERGTRCTGIFECIIAKGSTITFGYSHHDASYVASKNQKRMTISLFRISGLPTSPVQYCDSDNVTKLGHVAIMLPGEGIDRKVKYSFLFW